MELFRLTDPLEPSFRRFKIAPELLKTGAITRCDECGQAFNWDPPIKLVGENSKLPLGDFSSAGFGAVTLLSARAVDSLANFGGGHDSPGDHR